MTGWRAAGTCHVRERRGRAGSQPEIAGMERGRVLQINMVMISIVPKRHCMGHATTYTSTKVICQPSLCKC